MLPFWSPTVLDNPVVFAVQASISDDQHAVVEARATAPKVVINAMGVQLK